MQSETPSSGYIGNVAANMPRVPVHREPKPPPHRRSHEQHDAYRRSRDYDHHVENGHAHNNRSHEKRSNGKPKHQISTLTAHFVAAVGEFVGTFMFLFFSFIGQIMIVNQAAEKSILNGQSSSQQNIFTALLYGFSLLVNVWAFYRISGGLFNPAVTFGLVLAGAVPPIRSLFLFPAQLIAAMCAAGVAQVIVPGDIGAVQTSLSVGTTPAQGVFIEMFMTAELVFVVLMLAAEKSKDTFIAPVGIGLALFVSMMGGVYYTGGSLNPARSFGPAVVSTQFFTYHWIYWIGPCLGAAVAAGFYHFVKFFDYEQVNPGQDSAGADSDTD